VLTLTILVLFKWPSRMSIYSRLSLNVVRSFGLGLLEPSRVIIESDEQHASNHPPLLHAGLQSRLTHSDVCPSSPVEVISATFVCRNYPHANEMTMRDTQYYKRLHLGKW
jgi:hypothetical protein